MVRLTVAVPNMHRSSLEAALGHDVRKVLEWTAEGPADVVLGMPGEGLLAHCPAWPGLEGAAALVRVGYERLQDRLDMARLHDVGKALASEQDLDRLLDLILTHGRNLLMAEAGSIYLVVDRTDLLFAHTQNARVDLPYTRFQMPITGTSMAGFAALTGETLVLPDVYAIPEAAPYRFNDSYDRQAGYRTRSMLVVPIQDTQGEVLGVLQFINRLAGEEDPRPVPFHPADVHLAQSLAGQAGVAIKNAHLRRDIEHLFERFVDASVKAIEQRDPVTRGHSGRVAELTVGLALALNRADRGPFREVHFTDRQLRELRYASLLHDFGKVGVREQVLVKSKKLGPDRLELLLQRLRQRQQEEVLAALRADWAAGRPFDPAHWEGVEARHRAEAESLISLLLRSNEPTVLTEDLAEGLGRLDELAYTAWDGLRAPLLEPGDRASLTIRRGSLSQAERLEIESHVTHTYAFLSTIPWTPDLAAVPDIAYAHHERLNGQGYPRGLTAEAIPLQSRAMAIADIFDALTAQDRPYKAALPLERSLDILRQDAAGGHVDPDLLDLFVEARVYAR
ncbi:HD domain-containing phosphohydrolase [Mesoterricola sediminis]|uniref:Phosphohydrolase n=1 Tax=Mesoterricola sediminis TaxID=2927980 RepID=A0AA48KG14_9BACT|nr:HD domain-containing phosphohydrolase [Mesoterricola sediminis]BDU76988.1 phosphohydrolase [Mesoterricola sediminis]